MRSVLQLRLHWVAELYSDGLHCQLRNMYLCNELRLADANQYCLHERDWEYQYVYGVLG